MFTVLILQHLKVSPPKYHSTPRDDDIAEGLLRAPKPFHVHIEARDPTEVVAG